ncbi:MarR family winged helix-turn-helix transcriptional regulator [Liquorilactobacillus capillatus]|nr:MarR family transcriptional regulator [Liquorilactobacillus capillatus]
MIEPGHEPYDELCFSVYTTNRYFHHLCNLILQDYNLTYLQYMVLLVVKTKKQTTLTAICSKLDLANNTITPVVQKLVTKKWLTKKKAAGDSRFLEISLHAASLKSLAEIREKIGYVQYRFSQVAEQPIEELIEQYTTLNTSLIKLNQNLADDF